MACLLKLPAVLARTGGSRSRTYAEIACGTFPPPIKRGIASYWLDEEIEELVRAYAAGASADDLRALSTSITARRVHQRKAA